MVTKQKTERLTIANIVAIVGVVLLGVFSFLGRSYMSGGELNWDIVMSVAITAFTVFLLWFLIKAKGAENYLDNWKKAEFAALSIYIVFAIPVSLWGGIMHFFVVNDQKDSIKEYAKADLQKIDELFAEYKRNEGFNIDFGDELLECLSEKLKDYFLGDPKLLKEIAKAEEIKAPDFDGILKFDMDDISKGAFWPWNRKKRDIVANLVDEIREDNSHVEVVGEYEPNPLKRFFRRKAKSKALPKKEKYEQLTDGSERTEKTDENEIEQTEQLSPSEEFRRSQVVPSEELGKNEPEQPLNEMNEQENTKAQDTKGER